MNRPAMRCLLLVLAISPALLTLGLILKFGYNMHVQDEWDPHVGGLNILLHDHKLTFNDLYRQHNEHRILVPKVMFLVLASLSHWNEMWELIAQWIVVLLTSLGILWLSAFAFEPDRNWRRVDARALLLWLVANFLIFTPAAGENWIWGMGLANVMPMALIVATLVTTCSRLRPPIKIGLAILCALLATYTSGNGLLVWPLAGLMLAWPWRLRSLLDRKWILLAWLLAGCVIVGTYFIGYTEPEHPTTSPYAPTIQPALEYLPGFLGGAFAYIGYFNPLNCARFFGGLELLLLAVAIVLFVRRWFKDSSDAPAGKLLLWLMIASFALLSGAIASASRAGYGAEQAIKAARYVTFSLYLPVGLIYLLDLALGRLRRDDRFSLRIFIAQAVPLAAVIVLVVLSWRDAIAHFRTTRIFRMEAKAAMLMINALPNNPAAHLLIYPNNAIVQEEARRFEEMGFISPPLLQSGNARNIQVTDSRLLNDVRGQMEPPILTDDNVQLIGWAIFEKKLAPADCVFIAYDQPGESSIIAMAEMGQYRPDIAERRGSEKYQLSGFSIVIPRRIIPPGGVTFSAWAFDVDRARAYKLDGSMTVR